MSFDGFDKSRASIGRLFLVVVFISSAFLLLISAPILGGGSSFHRPSKHYSSPELMASAKKASKTKSGKQSEYFEPKSQLKYLLYTPSGHGADRKARWPLLVFLHGAGESGSGPAAGIVSKGLTGCPPVELNYGRAVEELSERFIVASPRTSRGWGDRARLSAFTRALIGDPKLLIDASRVYLSGVSMGGAGVWVGATIPKLFAAVAPVCAAGTPRPDAVSAPVWAFHGVNDRVVPVTYTDRSVEALRKAQPQLEVKYTRYKESPAPIGYPSYDGHASWMQVYTGADPTAHGKKYAGHDGPALFDWFLKHKLP